MTDFTPSATIQNEVLSFLVSSPTPEEIIAFHASEAAQARLRYLLDSNRNDTLSSEEAVELEEASQINRFVMHLKAKAHQVLADK